MLATLIKAYAAEHECVQQSTSVCSRAFTQKGLQVIEVKEPFSSLPHPPSPIAEQSRHLEDPELSAELHNTCTHSFTAHTQVYFFICTPLCVSKSCLALSPYLSAYLTVSPSILHCNLDCYDVISGG